MRYYEWWKTENVKFTFAPCKFSVRFLCLGFLKHMSAHPVEVMRLIVDFGLVILVWMVQTIVYPSFLYMAEKELNIWHTRYTTMITFFVAPLMFLQTGILVYQGIAMFSVWTLISIVLASGVWAITFLQAVPLHQKIGQLSDTIEVRKKLIQVNWPRTLLWTLIFGLGIVDHFS